MVWSSSPSHLAPTAVSHCDGFTVKSCSLRMKIAFFHFSTLLFGLLSLFFSLLPDVSFSVSLRLRRTTQWSWTKKDLKVRTQADLICFFLPEIPTTILNDYILILVLKSVTGALVNSTCLLLRIFDLKGFV